MASDFHTLRRSKGMTQKKLSEQVQDKTGLTINSNVFSTWERGVVQHPRFDYVQAVALVLGVPPKRVFDAVNTSWKQAQARKTSDERPPDPALAA